MAKVADTRRRNPRSERAILTAAHELCLERGYGNVTIEAIAARAQVGKQTVYRWWPSKGAIMFDIFMTSLTDATNAAPVGDFRTTMRNRLRALVAELRKKDVGPHIAALLGETQVDDKLADQWRDRIVIPARSQHLELIVAAQANNEIRADIDAEVVADLLFGPIWFRLLVTRDPLTSAYVDEVLDSVIQGIGKETASATPRSTPSRGSSRSAPAPRRRSRS